MVRFMDLTVWHNMGFYWKVWWFPNDDISFFLVFIRFVKIGLRICKPAMISQLNSVFTCLACPKVSAKIFLVIIVVQLLLCLDRCMLFNILNVHHISRSCFWLKLSEWGGRMFRFIAQIPPQITPAPKPAKPNNPRAPSWIFTVHCIAWRV